ncbi:MAG: hypothetical protein IIY78_09835 [Clostridia bacterium]|nr:hypothetical protein [Clostridia bacterium]
MKYCTILILIINREGIIISTRPVSTRNAESEPVADLTYNDYLSAVYSYEDASKASFDAAARLQKIKSEYETIRDEKIDLERKIRDIDNEITMQINAKIGTIKSVWKKSQERFDVKLEQQKAMAIQKAQNDAADFEEKLNDDYTHAVKREKQLKRELVDLSDEYSELERASKSTSNLTVTPVAPDNQEAYDFLVYAKDKKLLTQYQNQMLDQDVNAVCDTWVHDFDELREYQHEFVNSEFYEKLKKGSLTTRIQNEIAATVAIVTAAVMFIISLLMCAPVIRASDPQSVSALFKVACGYNIILSSIGFTEIGVLVSQFVTKYNKRHKDDDGIYILKFANRLSPLWFRLIFGVFGFGIGCFVFRTLTPVQIAVSAFVCALMWLFVKRFGKSDGAHKFYSRFNVFRDRARADIFAEYEMLESGKYNFMVYCYLKYEDIQLYLSIQESQKKIKNVQKAITSNREKYKRASSQHEQAQSIVKSKQGFGKQIEKYRSDRKAQLKQELDRLEAKRPPEPDYEKEAKAALGQALQQKYAEKEKYEKKLTSVQAKFDSAEAALKEEELRSIAPTAQLERINDALRSWKQTPLPEATRFRIVDSMCLETHDNISILHHDSEPYVIRYKSSGVTKNAESMTMLIFHYVHGLCKINPRRLLQINIFDYISDPNEYHENRSFRRLKADGFLEAVQTMNQFELRLFRSPERSRIFFDVFKSQCRRISAAAEKYSDRRDESDDIDIAFANKWTTKRNRFTYQVCIFIVPRESDKNFSPPVAIVELIRSGEYKQKGVLPVFFADESSISPKWAAFIENFGGYESPFDIRIS